MDQIFGAFIITLVVIALVFVIMTLAGAGPFGGPANHNPKTGWVRIDDSTDKKCDGSTLLYRTSGWSDSIRVVVNSSECK